jgi:hypothetical protein
VAVPRFYCRAEFALGNFLIALEVYVPDAPARVEHVSHVNGVINDAGIR